jgi:hypothetical protein
LERSRGRERQHRFHAALVAGAEDERFAGLASEPLHHRRPAAEGENPGQRLERDRKSDVRGDVIDQITPPTAGLKWARMPDRGADNAGGDGPRGVNPIGQQLYTSPPVPGSAGGPYSGSHSLGTRLERRTIVWRTI